MVWPVLWGWGEAGERRRRRRKGEEKNGQTESILKHDKTHKMQSSPLRYNLVVETQQGVKAQIARAVTMHYLQNQKDNYKTQGALLSKIKGNKCNNDVTYGAISNPKSGLIRTAMWL